MISSPQKRYSYLKLFDNFIPISPALRLSMKSSCFEWCLSVPKRPHSNHWI